MCYNIISSTDKYAFWPILFILLKHTQDTQPCKTAQIQTDLYKKKTGYLKIVYQNTTLFL